MAASLDRFWQVLPKPLLFGLLGIGGCVAGVLAGELLLMGTPPPTPALIFSDQELNERLRKAGAKTGDVRISLRWDNYNDLDLHCIEPSGEEISYSHKRSRSGGELDVDRNARSPYVDDPVENIYWPQGSAPAGQYKVYVNHYSQHGGSDQTAFVGGVIAEGRVREFSGAISHGEPKRLVYEFTVQPGSQQRSGQSGIWYTALIIGLWTALLAVALSLTLVMGQNHYLHRPLLSLRQGLTVLGGALAAGLISGGVSQVLFGLVAHTESLAQTGQVAGWVLLGGLLGRGMGLFIPNLPGRRAAVAGTIGGLLGAMAFVAVSPSAGGLAGRFVGAVILGLLIGLMIALVEQWTREAWLEVRYGPRETRTVSLGAQPVSVGSAAGCTIYAAGAPPVAARYTLTGGQIRYEDVAAGQSRPVRPGARQQVGALTLTVCGAAPAPAAVSTAAPPARELVLRLSSGQTLPLRVGGRLSVQELRGLEAPAGDGVGAEVVRHPEEPGVLGLKNLSQRPWVATGAQGGRRPVEPGRSVRLAAGTRIDFGALEGEVQ